MTDYLSTLISLTNFTTDDGVMLLPIKKDQLEKYKSAHKTLYEKRSQKAQSNEITQNFAGRTVNL